MFRWDSFQPSHNVCRYPDIARTLTRLGGLHIQAEQAEAQAEIVPFWGCSVSLKRFMRSDRGILFGTMSCRKIAAGHSDTAIAAQSYMLLAI